MEYLLKASAVIAIFYVCYKVFLQRDTFFNTNRWYLLIGLVAAFTIPKIIIPIYVEYTPMPLQNFNFSGDINTIEAVEASFSPMQLLPILYLTGVTIFFIKFLIQLGALTIVLVKNKKQKLNNYTYVETNDDMAPFSFFNWIVYNPKQFNKTELDQIITHEKVHAKQRHSIDILLTQLASVIFWFNPIIWFYNKDLKQNLEFIADKVAVDTTDCKTSYQYTLLKASVPTNQLAVTNNFYTSLIKKRIVMLQKSKSKKINLLKYAVVIPILTIFLMSFNTETVYVAKTEAPVEKLNTENIIENSTLEALDNLAQETTTNINVIEEGSPEVKSKHDRIFIKKSILKISGTVTNTKGLGLPGVNILIEGKSNGAVTDFDGNYRIEAKKGDILIFSYTGMVTQKIKATKKKIDVVLAPSNIQVVSYAYNNKIYFVDGNQITEKEFKKIFAPNFETIIVLDPKDAIKKYGTKGKGGAVEAFTKKNSDLLKVVQGNTAKNDKKPLILLDGEEVSENVLNSLDPNKIKYVNVIKDTKAVTIYGDKAKHGFVEIVTKKDNQPTINFKVGKKNVQAIGTRILKGTITNTEGRGLPGTNIIIKGTKRGAVTDFDGNYAISVSKNDVMVISYIGYKTQEIAVKNKKVINPVLKEDSTLKESKKISFGNPSNALVFIDGKESTREALTNLDKKSIESLTVFKDATAKTMYGEKGKNGVILITLKKNINFKIDENGEVTNKNGIKIIKGKITNEESLGLPGTNIIIKGTSNGTQTDFDGNYAISVSEKDVLVISYKGYKTQEVKIKNKKEINVVLKE